MKRFMFAPIFLISMFLSAEDLAVKSNTRSFNETKFAKVNLSEQNNLAEQKLCEYVKKDSERQFLGVLLANNIRLYSNYRQFYCKPEPGFEGGSLLKTAYHFGSEKMIERLVNTLSVDDIFWEWPVPYRAKASAFASRN
jgi:hypothetical protein